MSDIELGIRLTGDSGGLVGEVRISDKELEKLGNTTKKTGQKSKGAAKAIDVMSTSIKKSRSFLGGLQNQLFSLKGLFLSLGAGVAAKSFLEASSTAEQYRIRLTVMLGSQKEANKLFDEMAIFAGKVPFEYEQVMASATQLSGVLRGGTSEIKQWMPLIADLAATSGLSIDQTTQQVIRMFSAGAGSADLFRERGVLAMLGFEAGVSYSAEESRKKLMSEWTKAGSQFAGATGLLADSWEGMLSMMGDKWFQFRTWLMDGGLFDYFKAIVGVINNDIDSAMSSNQGSAESWANTIIDGIESAAGVLGIFADGFHGLHIIWVGLKAVFLGLLSVVMTGIAQMNTGLVSMTNGLLGWAKGMLNILAPFSETARAAQTEITDLQNSMSAGAQEIQGWAGATRQALSDTLDEMHNLAMDLPSNSIKQKLADIRKQFDLNRQKSKAMADGSEDDGNKMSNVMSDLKSAVLDTGESFDFLESNATDYLDRIQSASKRTADAFEDDWVSSIRNMGFNFRNFIDSVIDEIQRMQYQATVGNAAQNIMSGLFGSLGTSFQYNTNSGSQQTQMLQDQDLGLGNRSATSVARRSTPVQSSQNVPGGNTVMVTNYNDFSSAGSIDESRFQQMLDENSRQTEARIYQQMNRGGSVSRNSGRR